MPDPTAATEPTTQAAAAPTAMATGTVPDTGAAPATAATEAAATEASAPAATAAAVADYTDFKTPEGYKLDGEAGQKFKSMAKEMGLTQEQAQKLVDFDAGRAVKAQEEQTSKLHKASFDWLEAAKADKEIGGANLETSVAVAKKALDTFGSPELKQMLQLSGLGNHPEVIRAFNKIGKAISEDGFVQGGKQNAAGDARKHFPNSNMNP